MYYENVEVLKTVYKKISAQIPSTLSLQHCQDSIIIIIIIIVIILWLLLLHFSCYWAFCNGQGLYCDPLQSLPRKPQVSNYAALLCLWTRGLDGTQWQMQLSLPPLKHEYKKPGTSEKRLLPTYSLIYVCRIAPAAALSLVLSSPTSCRSHRVPGRCCPLALCCPTQGQMDRDWAPPAATHRRPCADLIRGGEERRKTRFLCQLFVCHSLFPQRSKKEAGVEQQCDNESQFGPYFAAESCATTHFVCLGAGCKETG